VIRVERDGVNYYVKRYTGAGKGLRRYLGKPRVKSEWQNLKRFAKWGIPTAEVVAWGLERKGLAYSRGAMITRELPAPKTCRRWPSATMRACRPQVGRYGQPPAGRIHPDHARPPLYP
jgi:hypothetical protein